MNDAFSTELELLLACCRWPQAPEAVRAVAGPNTDWHVFKRLLERHGVVALAANALWKADVAPPTGQLDCMRQSVDQQVRRSLQMARETAQVAQAFAEAGIPCRFFKGPVLAMQAYGDLGLKRSADIDVLVAPALALMARGVLESAGFSLAIPHQLDEDSFDRYLRWAKEVIFANENGVVVELHVRLFQNRRSLRTMTVDSDHQDVTIGSIAVPTFSDRALYPYLCHHGAGHAWSRIKWLADLNAFLESRDIIALHRSAVEQGLSNESLVALSLCRELFGRNSINLEKLSGVARFQRRIALAAIRHSSGGTDISTFSRVGLGLLLSNATIGGSIRSMIGSVAALWIQPPVRARYQDKSAWIFHVLRIPRFLVALPRKLRATSAPRTPSDL